MNSQTEIIVKNGSFVRRRITEEDLGQQADIIRKLSQEASVIIPDAFDLYIISPDSYRNSDKPKKYLRTPCHIGKLANRLVLAHRLPYYPLFGHFNSSVDPEFDIFTGSKEQRPNRKYALYYPAMWMMYNFYIGTGGFTRFNGTFLATQVKDKFYSPLLPNIHDTGGICLGDIEVNWRNNMRETAQHTLNEFVGSVSNYDLCENTNMYKFNKETGAWVPPERFFDDPVGFHRDRIVSANPDMLSHILKISDRTPYMDLHNTPNDDPEYPEDAEEEDEVDEVDEILPGGIPPAPPPPPVTDNTFNHQHFPAGTRL